MSLELKIPPVVLVVITALMMAIQAQLTIFPFKSSWLIASSVIAFGFVMIAMAVWQFKKEQTTVNPLNPNQSSQIVNTGIFAVSRNPMYVGMTIILIGIAMGLGEWMCFIWIIGFVLYMTKFQIKPEERILADKFGNEFIQYCQRVRRWL